MFRHIISSLILCTFLNFVAYASAQTYDVGNDFSAQINPSGAWSYGWKSTESATQLQLMTEAGQYEITNYWRDPMLGSDGGYWSIAHNPTSNTHTDGATEWAPNAVVFHARPNAITTIRWTAPTAGTYDISTIFTSAHYWQWGNNKQVSIALNGCIAFSDTLGNYGTNTLLNLTDLSLHANDTIDFMLKGLQTPFGVDYYVTSTRLGVQITRTGESLGSAIAGTLTLENIVTDASPQEVTFLFHPDDNSGDILKTALIPSSGMFVLVALPPKSYTVHVKGAKWLAKNVVVDTTSGGVSCMMATLLAGDANNDNSTDVLDLDLLIQAFDSDPSSLNWNEGADFNCDDSVDVLDLDILIRNFDKQGDP
jgi:hypothetical protein